MGENAVRYRYESKVGHLRLRPSYEERNEGAQTLEETCDSGHPAGHRMTESLTPKTTSTTDDELRRQVQGGQCPSATGWPAPALASLGCRCYRRCTQCSPPLRLDKPWGSTHQSAW